MLDDGCDVARPSFFPRAVLGLRVLTFALRGTVAEEVLDALVLAEDHGADTARVVAVALDLGGRERDEH